MPRYESDFNINITHSKQLGLTIPLSSVQDAMKGSILTSVSQFMADHKILTPQQTRYLVDQMNELTTVKTTIEPNEPSIKGETTVSFSDPLLCAKLGLTRNDWDTILENAVTNSEINNIDSIRVSEKLNDIFTQCQKRIYHDLKKMHVLLPSKLDSLLSKEDYKGANIPSQGTLNAVGDGQLSIPLYISDLGSFTPDDMQCIPLKDALPLLSKSCLSLSLGREPLPLSFPSNSAPVSNPEALSLFIEQSVSVLCKYASHELIGNAFDAFLNKSTGGDSEMKGVLLDAIINEGKSQHNFPVEKLKEYRAHHNPISPQSKGDTPSRHSP